MQKQLILKLGFKGNFNNKHFLPNVSIQQFECNYLENGYY